MTSQVAKIGEGGARLTELFATDQLASEMKAGRVFAGFQEGKMGTFKPTFKVQRKEPKIAYDVRSPFVSLCHSFCYSLFHKHYFSLNLTIFSLNAHFVPVHRRSVLPRGATACCGTRSLASRAACGRPRWARPSRSSPATTSPSSPPSTSTSTICHQVSPSLSLSLPAAHRSPLSAHCSSLACHTAGTCRFFFLC